ncbi:MAG TPA: PfkB family carbohydrate kinase [Candidatus Acidoferrales bacterium]|nr:PfkB family carbohydrate kinase [Candidatus Acidoferrales bacterium]
MTRPSFPPTVLVLSGHDPSGGAGQQADIEAIAAQGAHAAVAITCLTVQDTANVRCVEAVAPELIIAQAEAVLADQPVAAIKLGLLGTGAIVTAVAALLARYPAIPVVTDPVLVATGGGRLAADDLIPAVRAALLPRTTVLTPNAPEARALAGIDDLATSAEALRALGAQYVLVTGGDEPGARVENRLHGPEGAQAFTWPRLPGPFHGSGCTLAAALAARLALGESVALAAERAQAYVARTLTAAFRPGRGAAIPRRWLDDDVSRA